jgi:hypothetical protein
MELKTNVPGIYKVGEGVLINKDNDALIAYKYRKQKEQKIDCMEKEVLQLKDEIRSLSTDMQEIKALLRGLIK